MRNLLIQRILPVTFMFSALLFALPTFAADAPVLTPPATPTLPLEPMPAAAAAQLSASNAAVPAVSGAPAKPTVGAPESTGTGSVIEEPKIAPIPAALGGVWKGKASRLKPDNSVESETYRVEVNVRQPEVLVAQVATEPVPSPKAQPTLNPATVARGQSALAAPDLLPAKWDGRVLQQTFCENFTKGAIHVAVTKRLSVSLEPDGKHARFDYKVAELRVRRGARTERTEKKGTLLLSRER